VRDETDEAYWLALTVLNSGADDATLEPHDYEVITVPAKDCTVPPVEPPVEEPPVVTPPVEPPVVVPPVVTEPPVTVETPLVPIPAEEPVATQPVSKVTVERLPETGGEFDWTWWMIGGILLMGAGIVAVNLGMRKED
jgi:LPXTG-motif cell wall-anchored protein